jgi:hypothetical protein
VADLDKTNPTISVKEAQKPLAARRQRFHEPTKQEVKQACDDWAKFMLRQYLKQRAPPP